MAFATRNLIPDENGNLNGGGMLAPIAMSQPPAVSPPVAKAASIINPNPTTGIPQIRAVAGNGNLNGDGSMPGQVNTGYNYTSSAATAAPAVTTQQAVLAPEVKPQTGTAATYNATLAKGSPNVVAGTADYQKAGVFTSTVNDATDTVEGRTANLIDANSPLMMRAAQLARQQSNASGMLNSTSGLYNAQAALYDKAIQIATPDAAEYSATRRQNTQAQNTAELQNAQLYTDVSKFNVANALQAGIVNQDQANRIAQFNAQSENQASQFNAASAQDMAKFNVANLLQAGIINQEQANRLSMFNTDQNNQLSRLQTDIAGRIATANIGANASIQSATIGANASMANAQLSAATQTALGTLDANTRRDIARIQTESSQLINTNNNAATLYQANMNNIASIQNNVNLTPEARQTAIENLLDGLNGGLRMVSQMGRVNIDNLLQFNIDPITKPKPEPEPEGGGIPDPRKDPRNNPTNFRFNFNSGGGG